MTPRAEHVIGTRPGDIVLVRRTMGVCNGQRTKICIERFANAVRGMKHMYVQYIFAYIYLTLGFVPL